MPAALAGMTRAQRPLLTALAAAWLALQRSAAPTPYAGPYIAYADNLFPCGDDEYNHKMAIDLQFSRFDPKKPSDLQLVSGHVMLNGSEGLDDSYWGRVRLDSRFNMEWKENAFIFNFPKGGCSALRDHMPDFTRLAFGEHMTLSPCSIPPRVYAFEDERVNWTFPKFPIMPYGHWRFHMTMGRGPEASMCFNTECHTVPRPKL